MSELLIKASNLKNFLIEEQKRKDNWFAEKLNKVVEVLDEQVPE